MVKNLALLCLNLSKTLSLSLNSSQSECHFSLRVVATCCSETDIRLVHLVCNHIKCLWCSSAKQRRVLTHAEDKVLRSQRQSFQCFNKNIGEIGQQNRSDWFILASLNAVRDFPGYKSKIVVGESGVINSKMFTIRIMFMSYLLHIIKCK